MGVPIHLGYTSGKGFTKGDEADDLIEAGVKEVSSPSSRRTRPFGEQMNDRHPEAALANLRRFAEECDVYAASVLIPGVNDGP